MAQLLADLTAAEAAITAAEGQITNLWANMASAGSRLNSLESTADAHGTRLGAVESKNATQDTRLGDLESAVSSLASGVSNAIGLLADRDNALATIIASLRNYVNGFHSGAPTVPPLPPAPLIPE